MFAVFKRAISCRSSCTLWRNCSIVVATVRFYTRGVRSVHKTEHLSAAFGSVAPKTPTPVFEEAEIVAFLDSITANSLKDIRDKELCCVLLYSLVPRVCSSQT